MKRKRTLAATVRRKEEGRRERSIQNEKNPSVSKGCFVLFAAGATPACWRNFTQVLVLEEGRKEVVVLWPTGWA